MKTYIDQDGNKSVNSDSASAWSKIHNSAPFSKKKMKISTWRSAVHRHPGECGKPVSARTQARKAASAERIRKYKVAETKYLYLAKNSSTRVSIIKGVPTILVREKGKFTGEKIVLI